MSVRSSLSDNRPTWHHPRILMVLLTVFLCGAAAGALIVRVSNSLGAPRVAANAPQWKEGQRELTITLLKKELNLTPAQAQEIETVLDDFVLYYQNLQGQMDDWRNDGKKRIMVTLTPEQRTKFEKLLSNRSTALR
ncbi:MAG: hypothetical protein IPP47_08605 [Bryobacterales bacterium]|nr:hypothetical protein [Bryobacterales bacterium]